MGDRAYYMDSVKFIRDLVHGYVYLTKFDIALIDTPEFQRLKDIRQLTCQNVYPAARHTRFEHSLGVLELTRRALKNLNRNGILTEPGQGNPILFDDQLIFNAGLAALLHDVGHCPFSHMGEVEFDKDEVFLLLCDLIAACPELQGSSLLKDCQKHKPGSTHEQMSCVVILGKLYHRLSAAGWEDDGRHYCVDFELIVRSIIGLPYDTLTAAQYKDHKEKNVIVNLIYSPIFDMDKLDYIMRDSYSTGIGTPQIDTHRLFKNMYIKSERDFTLVFLHRAVPALQNMVEARDALYMYVYNHHLTVFSDFMYSYIFRRLAHNAEAFQRMVIDSVPEEAAKAWEEARVEKDASGLEACEEEDASSLKEVLSDPLVNPITHLGIAPKAYLFSPEAIVEQKRSDSDMISLLHDIHYLLSQYGCFTEGENKAEGLSELTSILCGEMQFQLENIGLAAELAVPQGEIDRMIDNIRRVFTLIDKYARREFLKPWWKTNFEFTNFIDQNFRGTQAQQKLADWICHNKPKDNPRGDEFRSQLAKHVIYITSGLYHRYGRSAGLLEPLEDGDFFVIERSAHFFDEDTISKLNIALKNNEILGNPEQKESSVGEYFIGTLTTIIPQRNFYAVYEKKGFYIFSKPLPEGVGSNLERERHYRLIEDIFIYVAKRLIDDGEFAFQEKFVDPSKEQIKSNEMESGERMLEDFAERKGFVKDGQTG